MGNDVSAVLKKQLADKDAKDKQQQNHIAKLEQLEKEKREEVAKLRASLAERTRKLRREYNIPERLSPYDLVLKSTDFQALSNPGWALDIRGDVLQEWFLQNLDLWNEEAVLAKAGSEKRTRRLTGPPTSEWDCTIVGIIGFYDRGKTWLLNKLTASHFESSKRYATDGLSFALARTTNQMPMVILDTAGFGSPVSGTFRFATASFF